MEAPLAVWADTPPAAAAPPSAAANCSPRQPAAMPSAAARAAMRPMQAVQDKENALPEGTPLGGPAMLPLSGGAKKGSDARRPLIDVTGHFAAHDAGSICIGALGGSFGMPTDLQPAAQLVASCRVEAARAAQARAAVVKRQALRSMR